MYEYDNTLFMRSHGLYGRTQADPELVRVWLEALTSPVLPNPYSTEEDFEGVPI